MGLFDSNMLLEENYQPSLSTEVSSVPVDESYFSIAIKELNTINYNYYNMNKILCRSLLEAEDNRVLITESFDGFIDGIKKIIDKFLDLIKRIFSRFNTFIHKLFSSDKHLLKEKKLLQKFNGEDEFTMDVYKYTYLDDPNFPKVDPYNELTPLELKDYEFATSQTIDPGQFLTHITTEYNNKKTGMDAWYDEFRGKVITNDISQTVPYPAGEYGNELFKKYRNGESSRSNETITSTLVFEALDRFERFDKTMKSVSDIKSKLEKEYKRIKSECKASYSALADDNMPMFAMDNANKAKYNAAYNNADAKTKAKLDDQINLIMKLEMDKIQSMCNIHALAFSAKLDAIKEAYKQDKRVLYAALARIKKKHKDLYKEATVESLETLDAPKIINLDLI